MFSVHPFRLVLLDESADSLSNALAARLHNVRPTVVPERIERKYRPRTDGEERRAREHYKDRAALWPREYDSLFFYKKPDGQSICQYQFKAF